MKRVPSSLVPPITLNRRDERPLYRQVYDWFQHAIASGQLRPGQRVPSTRTIAAELNISRIPVLNAFEQLQAEGYLESFTGAGTCVARSIPQEKVGPSGKITRPVHGGGLRKISRSGLAAKRRPAEPWLSISGAFRMHAPALDHFPVDVWSRFVARNARKRASHLMAYGGVMGYRPFREAVAEYLGAVRAVRCDPSQVMIVAGSQQGLHISAGILVNRGDPVWMEEPGYPGAHRAFAAVGARLIPVPVDEEGLNVEEGIRRCPRARAAFITPSHQYPLGKTMSATRRMQLLNWASRSGSWIIEDDYDNEYHFGIRPIASLQGLDSDARVIYAGTFSKVLFPALRVGYLVVPADLVPAFSSIRDAVDIFPPALYHAVLTDFIQERHLARHLRRMRMLYKDRRSALAEAIRDHMGDMLEVVSAEAGMYLAALLPPGVDDMGVSRKAAEKGVSAMPLSACCLKRPARGGLVLGYGCTDKVQILQGVRVLKEILEGEIGRRRFRH